MVDHQENAPVEKIPGFDERPLAASFAGIIEGPCNTRKEIEKLVREIERLSLAPTDLEIEGGTFSLMFSEMSIKGDQVTMEKLNELHNLLTQLVQASPRPNAVESTLRCMVYFRSEVLEIAFATAGGELHSASRQRPAGKSDLARVPVEASAPILPTTMPRRKALQIGGLLFVVFILVGWQQGYFERLFCADSANFSVDYGLFAGLLEMEKCNDWGRYQLTFRRGPDYPATVTETKKLETLYRTNEEKAALDAVIKGRSIYARLLNPEGKTLAMTELPLGHLVSDPLGKVSIRLPGRMDGHSILLTFSSGGKD